MTFVKYQCARVVEVLGKIFRINPDKETPHFCGASPDNLSFHSHEPTRH